jgi:branched-chain amino acid aminotransferase
MSMADRDGFIWYDGKLVPWRQATTHVLTHTLHYGMGVFEGHPRLQGRKGHRHFPSRRAHRPPVQLGVHLPDEDAL